MINDSVNAVVARFNPPQSHWKPISMDFAMYAEQSTLEPESSNWTWFVPDVFSAQWSELSMETKYAIYWMACEAQNAIDECS